MKMTKKHVPHPSRPGKTWCGRPRDGTLMVAERFNWEDTDVCGYCYRQGNADAVREAKKLEKVNEVAHEARVGDYEMQKRQFLAALAYKLRQAFGKDALFQVAVVVTSTVDGEFVGVSSNVGIQRTTELLHCAAIPEGHVDHVEVVA